MQIGDKVILSDGELAVVLGHNPTAEKVKIARTQGGFSGTRWVNFSDVKRFEDAGPPPPLHMLDTVPFDSNYNTLSSVLTRAYEQASGGKGKERHAQGQSFDEQPMQMISRLVGSQDGMAFQAIKKIQESQRLPTIERQVAELLGAINYIAGMVVYLESEK